MNYINIDVKSKTTTRKLLKNKDFSSRSIKEILSQGYLINDKINKTSKDLEPNDKVKIIIADENLDYEPIFGKIDIVYEDMHILVINKEPNITVNSKNQISLANHIAYYFKENDIRSKVRFINRLDMNTSGLLMVSKNKYSMAYYQKQIEDNKFKKTYLAACEGKVDLDKKVTLYLTYDENNKKYKVSNRGKEAITVFKTNFYDKDRDITYINCQIKTGKTHQIRVSLSYLGYPIIGDRLYGSKIKKDRFLLHSSNIKVKKYLSNEILDLESQPNFYKGN